jgi:nicotinamide-nucleotide amidase
MEHELINLATNLGRCLCEQGLMLAIAESCTGGGICQVITEVSGSSQWFDRGFICYSNLSKIQMLDIKPQTLEQFGAVSRQTAIEMVQGALKHSNADCALSVTGIAGPDGGSEEKPVGTVFIAMQKEQQLFCYEKHFVGSRHEIRQQTIKFALETLRLLITGVKTHEF